MCRGKGDYSIGPESGKTEITGLPPGLETYEKIGAYAIIILALIAGNLVVLNARCELIPPLVRYRRTDLGGLTQFAQRILRRSGTGH